MTLMTGDAFFPGGMGEFFAPQNEFLVFEDGPSMDITLQWATYRDASDQTSLSRIWGGIHPPADDLPGRLIGDVIGPEAFDKAKTYFDGCTPYAGIYEIDPVNPRSDSTFSTLQEAFMCLSACGVSDTVRLELKWGTGPFTGHYVVDSIPGNDLDSPVILIGNNVQLRMADNLPFEVNKSVYLIAEGVSIKKE